VKFKLPLTTLFLDWSNGFPVQKLVIQGYLPFVAVTSGFSWMSAVAHFFVLIFFSTYYIPDLRRGINRFRWIEYAFSSSLMIGLIAMLFGMYDVISLVLIMSVNATMNLFGFLMETSNVGKKTYDWTPFTFGGKCQRCMIRMHSILSSRS
jgi:Heliorhodopsin